jgi:hypothetical protein
VTTVLLSGFYLAAAAEGSTGATPLTRIERIAALVLAFVIGSSTVWLGTASYANLGVLAVGVGLILLFRRISAARVIAPTRP